MALEDNPFAILTLVVAPAVLANACSLLALNTANRFGRANDRSRWLTAEMERLDPATEEYAVRQRQLERVARRAVWLLRAQTALYTALGMLAGSALVSVIGAGLATWWPRILRPVGGFALLVGSLAVASLVYGCGILIRETQLAVLNIADDTTLLDIRKRARNVGP